MEVKLSCNINEQVVCLKQWRLSSIQNTPFSTSFIYPITLLHFKLFCKILKGKNLVCRRPTELGDAMFGNK